MCSELSSGFLFQWGGKPVFTVAARRPGDMAPAAFSSLSSLSPSLESDDLISNFKLTLQNLSFFSFKNRKD